MQMKKNINIILHFFKLRQILSSKECISQGSHVCTIYLRILSRYFTEHITWRHMAKWFESWTFDLKIAALYKE